MREKRTPIPVGECVGRVMQYAKNRKQEIIALEEAHGRFLAEDLIADHDIPAFDRSPYDGFAVRSQDTKEASSLHPVELAVRGEIGAGSVFEHTVNAMQAVRIMTGAPIPKGCDAVAMLEVTKEYTKDNQPIVQIKRSFNSGDNISFQGEETTKDTVLA
ncbi:MAG: molybdopterin molybdenumtransferase MoeA, partial [Priestia megaterium]